MRYLNRHVVLCLGLLGPAVATAASDPAAAQVKPASLCPLLFGGQTSLERNRAQRQELLLQLAAGEHMVNLTHAGTWRPPTRIRYQGLELMATASADPAETRALIEVRQLSAGLACEPGLYELKVDHSLGGQAHVLAILDNVVLLEHEGQLRFWKIARTESPEFRMIWRSTWTLAGNEPAGAAGVQAGNPSGSAAASLRPTTHSTPAQATGHRTSHKAMPRPH